MSSPLMPPGIMPSADAQTMAKLGITNPFAAFAPPPATTPSMGFQAWASDPQNNHKVVPSMTAPDAPLQPNAGSPASVNPPATKPMASANPPSFTPPDTTQLNSDQAELQRLQRNGAGVNQVKNPFLRTLGRIVDAAGTVLAPGVASVVPGTTVHNWTLQNQAQGRVANDQEAIQQNLQNQQTQANTQHLQVETSQAPARLALDQQKAAGHLAQYGLKADENGVIGPDENSPVYQQQQQKLELADAQTQAARANVELRQATAAYEKAKTDPNSPLFKQTSQRLAIAQQNANAANQRATAYMGRYLQSAYGTGLSGNVLPGATIIGDEGGNQEVVGTGNAPQAVKSQANVAQFNDIEGATNSIEHAAKNLVGTGGKLNSPAVAAAIADPNTTSGQWLQGKVANSNLTPAERDYVVQVKAYKENLQTLRKSAGGGVSDSQVDRLMALAPGAATPDLDYLMRQTAQIRAMRGRLASGVSTAAGGLKVAGRGNPLAPPAAGPPAAATYKQTATGPNGHKIGSNDGNTWFDVKTGKKVQ